MNPSNHEEKNSAFDLSDANDSSSDNNKVKNDAELAEELEGGKNKKKLVFGLLACVGILGIGGLVITDPLDLIGSEDSSNTQEVTETNSSNSSKEDSESEDSSNEPPISDKVWWQEEETRLPVEVEDWTTKSYSEYLADDAAADNGDGDTNGEGSEDGENGEGENGSGGDSENDTGDRGLYEARDIPESVDKLDEYIAQTGGGSFLWSGSNALPSEGAGYTSDFSKMVMPDGSLNPMFSAWTREKFNVELQKSITRFINPEFGGWAGAQYSSWPRSNDQVLVQRMADMFTADYLTEHKDDPVSSYLPIYADWKNNDYGMGNVLLSPGPRWIGTVENGTISFDHDKETRAYTAKVVAKVKYVAWTQDQGVVEKHGTLTLRVVQPESQRTHYLVFNDADLNME